MNLSNVRVDALPGGLSIAASMKSDSRRTSECGVSPRYFPLWRWGKRPRHFLRRRSSREAHIQPGQAFPYNQRLPGAILCFLCNRLLNYPANIMPAPKMDNCSPQIGEMHPTRRIGSGIR
jgi:hypothetical protein